MMSIEKNNQTITSYQISFFFLLLWPVRDHNASLFGNGNSLFVIQSGCILHLFVLFFVWHQYNSNHCPMISTLSVLVFIFPGCQVLCFFVSVTSPHIYSTFHFSLSSSTSRPNQWCGWPGVHALPVTWASSSGLDINMANVRPLYCVFLFSFFYT